MKKIRRAVTDDANLRYKVFLETIRPGLSFANAKTADATFNPDFPGNEIPHEYQ
jgi:hypothetical protein